MDHQVKILHTGFVTHDTQRFHTTRPDGFDFEPGQGVEVALDREEWSDKGRPFTPTSLTGDPILEFTIKEYPDHEGVTERLHRLRSGDELLMSDAFGTITYQGAGTFIAAGAGVTPFLAIVRRLESDGELHDCDLLFSNKTRRDVICEKELRQRFGDRCHLTLTREQAEGYDHGRIDRDVLERKVSDFDRRFYLCGPPPFVDEVRSALIDLGAGEDSVVTEE